jgi:hypothetical protein
MPTTDILENKLLSSTWGDQQLLNRASAVSMLHRRMLDTPSEPGGLQTAYPGYTRNHLVRLEGDEMIKTLILKKRIALRLQHKRIV